MQCLFTKNNPQNEQEKIIISDALHSHVEEMLMFAEAAATDSTLGDYLAKALVATVILSAAQQSACQSQVSSRQSAPSTRPSSAR